MRIKRKKEDNNENNIFWVTMTDLMTALVLVFIVLFFYTYMTSYYEKVQSQLEQKKATESLQEALKQQKINANIDTSGIVKISDLELFELNSYELSSKGKAYLEKFAPAYLNSIFTNDYLNKNVEKIIIEGHTDSQTFAGKYSADAQYMKNMELSLKRAFAVADFMTNTPYNKENGNKLRKMILVEGASFSSPIIVNGKEDFAKSRRVELKLVMKNAKTESVSKNFLLKQNSPQ